MTAPADWNNLIDELDRIHELLRQADADELETMLPLVAQRAAVLREIERLASAAPATAPEDASARLTAVRRQGAELAHRLRILRAQRNAELEQAERGRRLGAALSRHVPAAGRVHSYLA